MSTAPFVHHTVYRNELRFLDEAILQDTLDVLLLTRLSTDRWGHWQLGAWNKGSDRWTEKMLKREAEKDFRTAVLWLFMDGAGIDDADHGSFTALCLRNEMNPNEVALKFWKRMSLPRRACARWIAETYRREGCCPRN